MVMAQLLAAGAAVAGDDAVALISQATMADDIYHFGEFLELPGIAALAASGDAGHRAAHALLAIFAYDTYADYVQRRAADESALPRLNEQQRRKLRQLSIVTMCGDCLSSSSKDSAAESSSSTSAALTTRSIAYATLHRALDIDVADSRTLEDLLIATVYAGLVTAKLNQKQRCVRVSHAQARDVSDDDARDMVVQFDAWLAAASDATESLQQQSDAAAAHAVQNQIASDSVVAVQAAVAQKVRQETAARQKRKQKEARGGGGMLSNMLGVGGRRGSGGVGGGIAGGGGDTAMLDDFAR